MKYGSRRKTLTRKKVIVVATLVIAAILMIAGVLAIITSTKTVPSSGTIAGVNLGVFQDQPCTIPLGTSNPIIWGTLNPGDTKNVTVYLKNSGTTDMTLDMTPSNWVPSNATIYLTLTWDKESTTLNAGQSGVAANLTLSVSSGFQTGTAFSVDIVITGTHS